MKKERWLLVLFLAPILLAPGVLLAQHTTPPPTSTDGVFPAGLGYAALGLATAVYGTLAEVIRRLWTRNGELAALHEAEKEKVGEKHKEETEGLRAIWREEARNLRSEIDKYRDRLEAEQRARLDDLERWRKEEQEKMQTAWTALRDSAEGFKQVSRQLDKLLEGWNGEE